MNSLKNSILVTTRMSSFFHHRKILRQQYFYNKYYCKDTDWGPHLDGNRGWAQQAQYNKFVREWVEEFGW